MLQPENKIYQDFMIILQAMLIFNDNMHNFGPVEPSETTASPKSSISMMSRSEYEEDELLNADMIESELVDLTEQLQVREAAVSMSTSNEKKSSEIRKHSKPNR